MPSSLTILDAPATPLMLKRFTNAPAPHKFSTTQFNVLPPILALRELVAAIPDEDLAPDGREGRQHITIKYGIHTDNPSEVQRAVLGFGPVELRLGKLSLFRSDEHDVIKIAVEGDAIHRLNALLSERLQCTDKYPDYQPHLTLAYVKPGLGAKYLRASPVEGRQVTFNTFTFSDESKRTTTIKLTDIQAAIRVVRFLESAAAKREGRAAREFSDYECVQRYRAFAWRPFKTTRGTTGAISDSDAKVYGVKATKALAAKKNVTAPTATKKAAPASATKAAAGKATAATPAKAAAKVATTKAPAATKAATKRKSPASAITIPSDESSLVRAAGINTSSLAAPNTNAPERAAYYAKLEKVKVPAAQMKKVQAAVASQIQAKMPFHRPTIAEIHKAAGGTREQTLAALHALQKTGAIRLGAYTQARSTIPKEDMPFVLPGRGELLYYVGAGDGGGKAVAPAKAATKPAEKRVKAAPAKATPAKAAPAKPAKAAKAAASPKATKTKAEKVVARTRQVSTAVNKIADLYSRATSPTVSRDHIITALGQLEALKPTANQLAPLARSLRVPPGMSKSDTWKNIKLAILDRKGMAIRVNLSESQSSTPIRRFSESDSALSSLVNQTMPPTFPAATTPNTRLEGVEAFSSGVHHSEKYSREDLRQMASNFVELRNAGILRPTLGIGHNEGDFGDSAAPAYGMVDAVRIDERPCDVCQQTGKVNGETCDACQESCLRAYMICDFTDVPVPVADAIKAKRFVSVSAEVYPDLADQGRHFGMALRRVCALGADLPAVRGLAPLPVVFSDSRKQPYRRVTHFAERHRGGTAYEIPSYRSFAEHKREAIAAERSRQDAAAARGERERIARGGLPRHLERMQAKAAHSNAVRKFAEDNGLPNRVWTANGKVYSAAILYRLMRRIQLGTRKFSESAADGDTVWSVPVPTPGGRLVERFIRLPAAKDSSARKFMSKRAA